MKKITLLFSALFITALSQAQVMTITHSTTQNIVPNNTVACPTEPTNYLRVFDLPNEFGVTTDFQITAVEFGVEAVETSGTVPLNIYIADETDPTVASLTLVYSGDADAAAGDVGTVVSHTLTDAITIPAGSIFVVELAEAVDGIVFRIGSNIGGETAPSWLVSDTCGAGTVDSFGFDNDYVVNVVGEAMILAVGDNLAALSSVYPNPMGDVLNVKLPSNVQVTSATLVDALGRNTGAVLVNGLMNTANLSTGVYVLTVNTAENGSLTQKVIK